MTNDGALESWHPGQFVLGHLAGGRDNYKNTLLVQGKQTVRTYVQLDFRSMHLRWTSICQQTKAVTKNLRPTMKPSQKKDACNTYTCNVCSFYIITFCRFICDNSWRIKRVKFALMRNFGPILALVLDPSYVAALVCRQLDFIKGFSKLFVQKTHVLSERAVTTRPVIKKTRHNRKISNTR